MVEEQFYKSLQIFYHPASFTLEERTESICTLYKYRNSPMFETFYPSTIEILHLALTAKQFECINQISTVLTTKEKND
jgi:hypothetical protein